MKLPFISPADTWAAAAADTISRVRPLKTGAEAPPGDAAGQLAHAAPGRENIAPAAQRGPATIVMQEWWGLDEHIRSVCDRLATEGFFALAPDLFRGETTTQPSEAEQKMMALSMDQAEQDMCGAAAYL